jgi:hypothetical protein
MIITASLLVAFIPGIERFGYWRFIVIAVAVGLVVVLVVVGFQSWFQPGGLVGGPPA